MSRTIEAHREQLERRQAIEVARAIAEAQTLEHVRATIRDLLEEYEQTARQATTSATMTAASHRAAALRELLERLGGAE